MSAYPRDPHTETLLQLLKDPKREYRERAWQAFFERYRKLMFDWCRTKGLDANSCDEVVSDVYGGLTKKLSTFEYKKEKGSFKTWLRRQIDFAVLEHRKLRAKKPFEFGAGDTSNQQILANQPDGIDELETLSVAVEDEILRNKFHSAIEEARAKTSAKGWEVFVRVEAMEQDLETVCAELGVTVGYFYKVRQRVTKKSKQQDNPAGPAAEEKQP